MSQALIGIIGGSGLYQMDGLQDVEEIELTTPFGKPSDKFRVGILEGVRVAFLPRHGVGHRFMPSEINFRANIFGFKLLGVKKIISASAVGSLKLEHKPQDIVLPNQFVDKTVHRESTFFGNGIVAHISFAEPVCKHLMNALFEAGKAISAPVKKGGTYVCMEGPAFSTKAEAQVNRSLGFDVIGMTNVQEAKLAREAEICYSTMALVTDYDCWHESEEPVTVEMVVQNLNKNSENAKRIIREAVKRLADSNDCECNSALKNAIMTDRKLIPEEIKQKLWPIIGKYL